MLRFFLSISFLWLTACLDLTAQSLYPETNGDKVRCQATIEMKKGYMSGICILVNDSGVIKGSLFNEFGISALDFIYQPDKRKVKLLSVIKMLNKWYIKKVLKRDLRQVLEGLRQGKEEYHDERFKIDYKFSALKEETPDTVEKAQETTE